jgi:hypothetical protein
MQAGSPSHENRSLDEEEKCMTPLYSDPRKAHHCPRWHAIEAELKALRDALGWAPPTEKYKAYLDRDHALRKEQAALELEEGKRKP